MLRAVLEDLEAQITGHTEAVDELRARSRWWWPVLVVFLAGMALLGLWMAVRGVG